jgi:hypothetical protein
MPLAVIQIKLVGFAVLGNFTIAQHKPSFQFRRDDRFAPGAFEGETAHVANVIGAIIRDVKIECAVPIDVGKRERGAAGGMEQSCFLRGLAKFSAGIYETTNAIANRAHQQIKLTIAIDIRKDSAAGVLEIGWQTGGGSLVRKFPITEIAVELAGSFDPAREDIGQSVAVEIAESDTGTIRKNAIAREAKFAKDVREGNPGFTCSEKFEAGGFAFEFREFAPTLIGAFIPIGGFDAEARDEQDEKSHWSGNAGLTPGVGGKRS